MLRHIVIHTCRMHEIKHETPSAHKRPAKPRAETALLLSAAHDSRMQRHEDEASKSQSLKVAGHHTAAMWAHWGTDKPTAVRLDLATQLAPIDCVVDYIVVQSCPPSNLHPPWAGAAPTSSSSRGGSSGGLHHSWASTQGTGYAIAGCPPMSASCCMSGAPEPSSGCKKVEFAVCGAAGSCVGGGGLQGVSFAGGVAPGSESGRWVADRGLSSPSSILRRTMGRRPRRESRRN